MPGVCLIKSNSGILNKTVNVFMLQVKVLYVRNLMMYTTEQTIWKAMESVRGPECLERVKKLRDFAFVHFSDRESAKAAMECWNSECTLSLSHNPQYRKTCSFNQ
jgi:hypothetical protein